MTTVPAIINVISFKGPAGEARFYNTGITAHNWADGAVVFTNGAYRFFDANGITVDDCERMVNGDFSTVTEDIFEVDEDEDEE